jgi:hypothetical protein
MNSLVASEARTFAKRFSALVTVIRPFSSVNSQNNAAVLAKGISTFSALVRL